MQTTSIRVLFNVIRIPPGIIKVFTSNLIFAKNVLLDSTGFLHRDQILAILRRVRVIHTEVSLFRNPNIVKKPIMPEIIQNDQISLDA